MTCYYCHPPIGQVKQSTKLDWSVTCYYCHPSIGQVKQLAKLDWSTTCYYCQPPISQVKTSAKLAFVMHLCSTPFNFKHLCVFRDEWSGPDYLAELLNRQHPDQQLRSASLYSLSVPASQTVTHRDRRFAVAVANLWNRLPVSVRTAKTLPHYKTLLKTSF